MKKSNNCHQLVDYDRFNNSLTKLREKKDKSLGDEKNLFKVRPPRGSSNSAHACCSLNKISRSLQMNSTISTPQ